MQGRLLVGGFIFSQLGVRTTGIFRHLFRTRRTVTHNGSTYNMNFAVTVGPKGRGTTRSSRGRRRGYSHGLVRRRASTDSHGQGINSTPSSYSTDTFFTLLIMVPYVFHAIRSVFHPLIGYEKRPRALLIILEGEFGVFRHRSTFFTGTPRRRFRRLISIRSTFVSRLGMRVVFEIQSNFSHRLLFRNGLGRMYHGYTQHQFIIYRSSFNGFHEVLQRVVQMLGVKRNGFLLSQIFSRMGRPRRSTRSSHSRPSGTGRAVNVLFLFTFLSQFFGFFVFGYFGIFF